MIRRPPGSTRTYTPFPYTTLVLSRGHAHQRIKVSAGLVVGEIAMHIAQLRLDDCKIGLQPAFADIGPPLEFLHRLAFGKLGSIGGRDRKSTRLNSSQQCAISYAVFCLKKKYNTTTNIQP